MASANQSHIFNDPTRPDDPAIIQRTQLQLNSSNSINFTRVQRIIREIVLRHVDSAMSTYDPAKAMKFAQNICSDVKQQIVRQNFSRTRTIVLANVSEKAHQGINWQVGTLFDSASCDGWTSFEHETSTYIVNVFVACVYSD